MMKSLRVKKETTCKGKASGGKHFYWPEAIFGEETGKVKCVYCGKEGDEMTIAEAE